MLCPRAPLPFRCRPELAENRALPPALALLRAVVPARAQHIRGVQKLSKREADLCVCQTKTLVAVKTIRTRPGKRFVPSSTPAFLRLFQHLNSFFESL